MKRWTMKGKDDERDEKGYVQSPLIMTGVRFLTPQVFLKWLDRDTKGMKLASHLRHGMTGSEMVEFPFWSQPWDPLPPNDQLRAALNAYFAHTHCLYPCLNEANIRHYLSDGPAPPRPPNELMPLLYAVISIGACSLRETPGMDVMSEKYLELAWKALPLVLARPFKTSAQTLVVLALAFRAVSLSTQACSRCPVWPRMNHVADGSFGWIDVLGALQRTKEGVAWQVIGYAVRVLHSLGFHLRSEGPTAQEDARIFWCAYALDKMQSFDAGRPSVIRDEDCTVSIQDIEEQYYPLRALVSLCQHISRISTVLFSRNSFHLSMPQILAEIGALDQAVVEWAEALPPDLRPVSYGPQVEGPRFPIAATIGFQYHQT